MEETNEIQPEVGEGRPNNTEVVAKAKRRTYTAAYKRRIVERGAKMTGEERGAMLRSEGLYSSHLTQWRAELMRNGQMNEQGLLMFIRQRDVAYLLVLVWAIAGIGVKQAVVSSVSTPAWIAVVLIALFAVASLFARRPPLTMR